MKARWVKTCIAANLFAAATAQGETLYQRDGITLEGAVQMEQREAGVCHVLEERESAENYERTKANDGQALHVWRVEFAARNDSGKRLENLTAHFSIDSEWPPCTNWSVSTGIQYRWGDSLEVLQEPYGMEPGEETSRTLFVLAFDGQQPEFVRSKVDYRFAAGATTGPAGPAATRLSSGSEDRTGRAASQLPPGIRADLYLRQAEQAARDRDEAGAGRAMERLRALQAEHGLELTPEDHYRYAQTWAAAGEPQRAMAAAVRYLQLRGREAEHYTEALDLINREGSLEAAPASGNAASSRIGPGAPAGTPRVAVAQPQPGESRVFDGIQFVWVPAGEFLMGSESGEADDNERPRTRVTISRGFYLGKYEVTQAEWRAEMGTNPAQFSGCGPNCPVERVSWEDVQAFIGKLNAAAGGNRYRLPTEAEWEYAARAGTMGDRYGNLDAIAWCGGNNGDGTHPVGQKAPNAWGLYDMLGNVWEWVGDRYGDYPGGEVTDPRGPASGSLRVFRGRGGNPDARGCRASFRNSTLPGFRIPILGFRLLGTE